MNKAQLASGAPSVLDEPLAERGAAAPAADRKRAANDGRAMPW